MSTDKRIRGESIILAEFSALRDEIVARINLRHQMLVVALTLLGLLMAFGVKEVKDKEISTLLFLLYPILCTFLAMGWSHTDYRLGELGTYIRETIETKLPEMGWEHCISASSQPSKRSFKVQELSALGIFVGVEILSILVAFFLEFIHGNSLSAISVMPNPTNVVIKLILLGISMLTIGYTICLIRKRRCYTHKEKEPPKFLKISHDAIVKDIVLQAGNRGARKVLVTKLISDSEEMAQEVIWHPPKATQKCPVQVMTDTELAHFNQEAPRDRHYHKLATEIYMVIEGTMHINVDAEDHSLSVGDMMIINPPTVHQVNPNEGKFLCRVVTVNCAGETDKYCP